MQEVIDKVLQACDNNDLTISSNRIEVVHQPGFGNPYSESNITVNVKDCKLLISSLCAK